MRFQQEQLRLQREQLLCAEIARHAVFLNQLGRYLAAINGVNYVEPSLSHPSIGETPHVEVLSEILAMSRRGQIYNLTFALARKRVANAAAD